MNAAHRLASALLEGESPKDFLKRKNLGHQGSIQADIRSDNNAAVFADFNAAPWFAQATDKEILDLVGCNWGGDYPADTVAEWTASIDQNVRDILAYLVGWNTGFECHVNPEAALKWLRIHRPALRARLID